MWSAESTAIIWDFFIGASRRNSTDAPIIFSNKDTLCVLVVVLAVCVDPLQMRVRRRHCAENSTVFSKNFVRAKTTCG